MTGDRKAGGVGADREADGQLAVVLFADLSAVLPGDADGEFAFFRKTSIVGHPGGDRRTGGPLRQDGVDVVADGLKEDLVIPGRYGDDVMQGLVSTLPIIRVKPGGHGYQAIALSRQEEAGAVAG